MSPAGALAKRVVIFPCARARAGWMLAGAVVCAFVLGLAPARIPPGRTPPETTTASALAVALQSPPRVVAPSALDFGTVITGATAERTLPVSNGAPPPADDLIYDLSSPPGFSAPAGSLTAAAGAPANEHAIGMSTIGEGVKSGTLTVSSNDPDSASKPVALSGTVLRHASPSFDSLTVKLAGFVDFGDRSPGQFTEMTIRVHNQGHDALQARLSLESANITGGEGRFEIVGGFYPVLVAGTAQSYTIRFDDYDAMMDSTYEAILTFECRDESLPGATAVPSLTNRLRARVESPTAGLCFPSHQDRGDAPEGIVAYSSGTIGKFPSCATATTVATQELECGSAGSAPGPTGTVVHLVTSYPFGGRIWLGCEDVPLGVDSEIASKVNAEGVGLASACDSTVGVDCTESAFGRLFGQDECSGSADAGVVGAMQQMTACSTFTLTVKATNCASAGSAFLNVLVDWNGDGDWNDAVRDGRTGCAPEWAIRNHEVVLSSGCNTFVTPAFLAGRHPGEGWMRVTITDEPVLDDFPWNGSGGGTFRNGETEDYPVLIHPRPPVVISQIYGGGGIAGAAWRNDYIEFFNNGDTAVDLNGWSVQDVFNSESVTPLAGSLPPGGYYLVQGGSSGEDGAELPAPDVIDESILLGFPRGRVALVRGLDPLSVCPTSLAILDFVGYGPSNTCVEGAGAAPTPSVTNALFRRDGGCTDTDNNAADFVTAPASPRNSGTAPRSCASIDPAGEGLAIPASVQAGDDALLAVAVTPGQNPASTGISVTADLTLVGGTGAQAFFDDATHGDLAGGDGTFSYLVTVDGGTDPGSKALPVVVSDAQGRQSGCSIVLEVRPRTGAPVSPLASLGLHGLRPNPATRELHATLSLASGRPARLQLFDVAGRLVVTREVGNLGPGLHHVVLRDMERVASGIYLVRLSQGGRVASGRIVVCH